MDRNRLLALKIIKNVLYEGAKIKAAIDRIDISSLSDLDRAFIIEMVYGSIRHKIHIEWLMNNLLNNLSSTRRDTILNIHLAIYQIRFMRVPEWAAVDEAVKIEKKTNGIPSLVNAVLRNYIRKKNDLVPPSSTDRVPHLSITTSHPEWLVRRWLARFGREAADFMQSNNEIPPLTVRVNSLLSNIEEIETVLKERGIDHTKCKYSPDGLTITGSSFMSIVDLIGKVFVQDEASQLVGYLLSASRGQRILDACAAPGGKSTHLAQITSNMADIDAVEKSSERFERLLDNIQNTAASIVPVRTDLFKYRPDKLYDRILLDAPCTALGVIRRNPDVKYRHSEADLAVFNKRQLEMLVHVSGLLHKDGILVYSVCSTEPEETTDVVRDFLNIKRDYYIIKGTKELCMEEHNRNMVGHLIDDEGMFRTYPHKHNMDGFFAVRMMKK